MSQTYITSYFNKRKRAGDEVNDRKKVVVVDRHDLEAGVSVLKEVHVIHKALVLDTPESLHSVYKNKSLVEHVPIDCVNKLTRENAKPVSYESQGKASENHTNQERSQGRKATRVSKSSTQSTIYHILLKTNGAEAHNKEHPRNGTTLHTSAEDGSFLVRYCPTEVDDILNKIHLLWIVYHCYEVTWLLYRNWCKILGRNVLLERWYHFHH